VTSGRDVLGGGHLGGGGAAAGALQNRSFLGRLSESAKKNNSDVHKYNREPGVVEVAISI
jgi:hypothetical protein